MNEQFRPPQPEINKFSQLDRLQTEFVQQLEGNYVVSGLELASTLRLHLREVAIDPETPVAGRLAEQIRAYADQLRADQQNIDSQSLLNTIQKIAKVLQIDLSE